MDTAATSQSRHARFLPQNPKMASAGIQGQSSNVEHSAEVLSLAAPQLNAKVREYLPLVTRIARYVIRSIPSSVELDDMIQLGTMGLLEALQRYDPNGGASFSTYAAIRIRGAILDGLRRNDTAPRSLRLALRNIDAAICTLEQNLNRVPKESEVAAHLGCSLGEYRDTLRRAHEHQYAHWDDAANDPKFAVATSSESSDPLRQILAEDAGRELRAAVEQLPDRDRKVVELYFWKHLKLREIGKMLGISESRVCQLLREAVAGLRVRLTALPSFAG